MSPATVQTRRKPCAHCGTVHVERAARPGVCLTCDLIDRTGRGESVSALAARFGLPDWLIAEVVEGRGT